MHKSSLRRSKSLVPFHRSSDKKSRHRRRLQSGLEPLNAQRREEGVATWLRNKKYAKKLGREREGGFGSTGNHDNIRLIVVRRARKEGRQAKTTLANEADFISMKVISTMELINPLRDLSIRKQESSAHPSYNDKFEVNMTESTRTLVNTHYIKMNTEMEREMEHLLTPSNSLFADIYTCFPSHQLLPAKPFPQSQSLPLTLAEL